MRVSNVSDILIGQAIVFKPKQGDSPKPKENVIDEVAELIFRWNGSKWELKEIFPSLWLEVFGAGHLIAPEDILEIIDIAWLVQYDPEIPAKPKYKPGNRVIYDDSGGDLKNKLVGTIGEIELMVSARSASCKYSLVETPEMEGLAEDWILEVIP